jgi:hypothetical protein
MSKDFLAKFGTLTYFDVKKTKMNSGLKYKMKQFFLREIFEFRTLQDSTSFDRSPWAYEGSKNYQKIYTYRKKNQQFVPVTRFYLTPLVRLRRSLKFPSQFTKILLIFNSYCLDQNMEKLTMPIDSEWFYYPKTNASSRSANFYFSSLFPEFLIFWKMEWRPRIEEFFLETWHTDVFWRGKYEDKIEFELREEWKILNKFWVFPTFPTPPSLFHFHCLIGGPKIPQKILLIQKWRGNSYLSPVSS